MVCSTVGSAPKSIGHLSRQGDGEGEEEGRDAIMVDSVHGLSLVPYSNDRAPDHCNLDLFIIRPPCIHHRQGQGAVG